MNPLTHSSRFAHGYLLQQVAMIHGNPVVRRREYLSIERICVFSSLCSCLSLAEPRGVRVRPYGKPSSLPLASTRLFAVLEIAYNMGPMMLMPFERQTQLAGPDVRRLHTNT